MNPSPAKEFLQRIEKKFPGSTTWETAERIDNPPAALAKWIKANQNVSKFDYAFDGPDDERMYGGLEFRSLSELANDAKGWISETWVGDDEEQRAIWESAKPFAWLQNGDFLAFATDTDDDAPIVYLSHDDESKIIAPSFDHFIREWTLIGFIGPELWNLEPFLDEKTGLLRHDTESGEAILSRFADVGIELPS